MGNLEVEHVTGSLLCQIAYETVLFRESYHWGTYRSKGVTVVTTFTSHQCGLVRILASTP